MLCLEQRAGRHGDRPGRAAGADRQDGPQARPGRADLRPARAARRRSKRSSATCARAGTRSSCSACSIRPRSTFRSTKRPCSTTSRPAASCTSIRRLVRERSTSSGSPSTRAAWPDVCSRLGIDLYELATDQPLELALFDLVECADAARAASRPAAGPGAAELGRRSPLMGILAPLYLAGLAALSLPLILHLVRRTPQGPAGIQLADVSVAHAAAAHAPQPARPDSAAPAAAGGPGAAGVRVRPAVSAAGGDAVARATCPAAAWRSCSTPAPACGAATSGSRRSKQVEAELNDLAPQDEVALYTFGDRLRTHVALDRTAAKASESRGHSPLPKVQLVRQAA